MNLFAFILENCGGQFEGLNGTISYPEDPDIESLYCVYTISVPFGRACLEFTSFQTDEERTFVSVYDGTNIREIPMIRFVCMSFVSIYLYRIKHLYFLLISVKNMLRHVRIFNYFLFRLHACIHSC